MKELKKKKKRFLEKCKSVLDKTGVAGAILMDLSKQGRTGTIFQGWLHGYEGPVGRGQAFNGCGHSASLISHIRRMYTNFGLVGTRIYNCRVILWEIKAPRYF